MKTPILSAPVKFFEAKNVAFVLLTLVACAVFSGCATTDNKSPASAVSDAVTSPLNDLNLVHGTIPSILKDAQKQPYALPVDRSCDALAADIRALDEVLGADLDTPAAAGKPSLIERGSSAASNAAAGALKGAAEGVVPFRGWIRKLSGAERYSRDAAAAIAAGTIRRAYFKGIRAGGNCSPAAVASAAAAPATKAE